MRDNVTCNSFSRIVLGLIISICEDYNKNVEATTTNSNGRLLLLSEGKFDNKSIFR